jgi:hypothetical protein
MSFSSGRRFRVWDYNVSHNQLLLRSPISPDGDTHNIDVIFWGVEYLEITTVLHALTMVPPTAEDREHVQHMTGKPCDTSDLYCILSGERRFRVLALGFKVLRNQLDIFESSLEYFAGTDENRNLGEVLAHS